MTSVLLPYQAVLTGRHGGSGGSTGPGPFLFAVADLAFDVIAEAVFAVSELYLAVGSFALHVDSLQAFHVKDLLRQVVLGHEGPCLALPVVPGLAADVFHGYEPAFFDFGVLAFYEL